MIIGCDHSVIDETFILSDDPEDIIISCTNKIASFPCSIESYVMDPILYTTKEDLYNKIDHMSYHTSIFILLTHLMGTYYIEFEYDIVDAFKNFPNFITIRNEINGLTGFLNVE
jgi:hypothetical protein